MINIKLLIEKKYEFLSPSEQKVARYILNNIEDIITYSAKDLAEVVPTSQATIVRFCKKLGVKNYDEIKVSLAKETVAEQGGARKSYELDFHDSVEKVLEKVIEQSKNALDNTRRFVSTDMLEKAAQLMINARSIYIYGAAGSGLIAQDLHLKCIRIHMNAQTSLDSHVAMMSAANMTDEDVLFLVSNSGQTKEVLELLEVAKNRNIPTVLMTQHFPSPAKRMADIVLSTSDEEHNIRIGSMTSRLSQLVVIDTLYIALCTLKGKSVYERIIETHEVLRHAKR